MFSSLEHFNNQILRQEIDGKYRHYSYRRQFKKMMILGAISTILGIWVLVSFINLSSQFIGYSGNTNSLIFLPKGTSFMYIQVEDFYQNNLKYSRSINYDQLKGQTENLNLDDCAPFDFSNNIPYYPAGAISNTFFQDLIKIEGVDIDTNNISWSKDKEIIGITSYTPEQILIPENWSPSTNEGTDALNFNNNSDLPILNERFVNWVNLSMYTNFRKLWGILDVESAGFYNLEVESIFDFSKKGLYFTEKSWLGFKNYGFPIAMIGIGILVLISGLVMRKIAILNNIY